MPQPLQRAALLWELRSDRPLAQQSTGQGASQRRTEEGLLSAVGLSWGHNSGQEHRGFGIDYVDGSFLDTI